MILALAAASVLESLKTTKGLTDDEYFAMRDLFTIGTSSHDMDARCYAWARGERETP